MKVAVSLVALMFLGALYAWVAFHALNPIILRLK